MKTDAVIEKLANLFGPKVERMDELDAADFKDHAAEIWELRQAARRIIKTKKRAEIIAEAEG